MLSATATKAKPIIFSGDMVRAILDGRKSVTRRVVKPQPDGQPLSVGVGHPECVDRHGELYPGEPVFAAWWEDNHIKCPYPPGTRLWVRENWRTETSAHDHLSPSELDPATKILYGADADWSLNKTVGRARPSIHMPEWASRIELEVTGVKVERVQEISAEDADAEGFGGDIPCHVFPEVFHGDFGRLSIPECFGVLWDSIHGAGAWDRNEWVWCISFISVPAGNLRKEQA